MEYLLGFIPLTSKHHETELNLGNTLPASNEGSRNGRRHVQATVTVHSEYKDNNG